MSARVVERQTRQFEGLVVAIPCGFKSRPAHHLFRPSSAFFPPMVSVVYRLEMVAALQYLARSFARASPLCGASSYTSPVIRESLDPHP